MSNIYKFAGGHIADILMMNDEFCGIKCSHLDDYNDPYESFLTINYNQEPDKLALYGEAINMVTKIPASCFAKAPTIVPMWAHYANNSDGFAIEIDEEKLQDHFRVGEESPLSFGDIDYQDIPHEGIQSLLDMAHGRCKPRDMFFLRRAVASAAYFTKTSSWSYEQERRMLIPEQLLKNMGGHLILPIPNKSITSIIVGSKASENLKLKILNLTKKIGCDYFEIVIGKNSSTPFFFDQRKNTHIFANGIISPTSSICKECKEPLAAPSTCSWCQITEAHEIDAAGRNAFRVFQRAGILEGYINGMNNVSNRHKKR